MIFCHLHKISDRSISDEQAMVFMISLFRYLELGYPISEAVRSTKLDLFIEYKGLGNTWWSYLLFGNPYTIIKPCERQSPIALNQS